MRRKDKKQHDETDEQQTEAGEEIVVESEVDILEAKLAEAEEAHRRALADFVNYRRRAQQNETTARSEGAAGVLTQIVRTMDYFDFALMQDPEKATAASILDGVRMIKGEMLRSLGEQGVSVIDPATGDELDPHRHEAVGQCEAEGVEPGCVASVSQVGYVLHDRVLRPAKVMVRPAAEVPAADTDTESIETEETPADEMDTQERADSDGAAENA